MATTTLPVADNASATTPTPGSSRNRWNLPAGSSRQSWFIRWRNMVRRCHDPADSNYPRYGGRGITVCEAWRDDPAQFLADMGQPPKGMTLERIDNDGPYCPANCRWASPGEQALNRRSNQLLTFRGVTQPAVAWAQQLRMPPYTLYKRLQRGWSVRRALTVPVRYRGGRLTIRPTHGKLSHEQA